MGNHSVEECSIPCRFCNCTGHSECCCPRSPSQRPVINPNPPAAPAPKEPGVLHAAAPPRQHPPFRKFPRPSVQRLPGETARLCHSPRQSQLRHTMLGPPQRAAVNQSVGVDWSATQSLTDPLNLVDANGLDRPDQPVNGQRVFDPLEAVSGSLLCEQPLSSPLRDLPWASTAQLVSSGATSGAPPEAMCSGGCLSPAIEHWPKGPTGPPVIAHSISHVATPLPWQSGAQLPSSQAAGTQLLMAAGSQLPSSQSSQLASGSQLPLPHMASGSQLPSTQCPSLVVEPLPQLGENMAAAEALPECPPREQQQATSQASRGVPGFDPRTVLGSEFTTSVECPHSVSDNSQCSCSWREAGLGSDEKEPRISVCLIWSRIRCLS